MLKQGVLTMLFADGLSGLVDVLHVAGCLQVDRSSPGFDSKKGVSQLHTVLTTAW